MKNFKISIGIKMLLIAIILFITIGAVNSVSAATTTISSISSLDGYVVNGGSGSKIFSFTSYDGYNNLYCLNCGANISRNDTMNIGGDIYNMSAEEISKVFGSNARYNSFLWVLDNTCTTQDTNSDMNKIMLSNIASVLKEEKSALNQTYGINITDSDIDGYMNDIYANNRYNLIYTIQQALIWRYTNNDNSNVSGLNTITSSNLAVTIPNYYKYIYTAMAIKADNSTNYTSPNKSGDNGVLNYLNSLSLNSNSAVIDYANKKVGPFVIEGYNDSITDTISYSVEISGTATSDYSIVKDGNKVYVQFNNNVTLDDSQSYSIKLKLDVKTMITKGTYLYQSDSTRQPLVSLSKIAAGRPIEAKLVQESKDTFDLHLSKNIVEVYGKSTDSNQNLIYTSKYTSSNCGQIAIRTLSRVGNLRKGIEADTDSYLTNKTPIVVSTGDIVKYAITIHNEGSINGYATEITDYIADGLEIIDPTSSEYNLDNVNYGWTSTTQDGITIAKTNYLSNSLINAYNPDTNVIDSKVIYVYCKVTGKVSGTLLKNVAEITADKSISQDGSDVADRDSTPSSITISELKNGLDTWEGSTPALSTMNSSTKYDVRGKEDDDDYENVQVASFDLALTKTITDISYGEGQDLSFGRINGINTSTLGKSSTDADYTITKTAIKVKTGATVKYKITIYNEGNISGYAEQITDYLPAGLELASYTNGDGSVNDIYGWTVDSSFSETGVTKITTNYLSKDNSSENVISGYDGSKLDSKCVYVECTVTSDTVGKILRNVAEITKYGYYEGTSFIEANKEIETDIDSIEDSVESDLTSKSYNGNVIEKYENRIAIVKGLYESLGRDPFEAIDKSSYQVEDDDDFEQIEIEGTIFDLALRKSITAVNGESTTNGYIYNPYDLQSMSEQITRLPKITTSTSTALLKIGNGEYYHGKEAINVSVGDEVSYTLRVYNEGSLGDYNGYATEITDYLPAGLKFEKIATGYEDYTASTEELASGVTKLVLKYNGNKALTTTTSFLKVLAEQAAGKTPDQYYQEVTVICKVTYAGNGKILTNRAEITGDQAVDLDGNNIDVDDRDSTPASLQESELNLDNYYSDYVYGIGDKYITYYPGIEGNGTDVTKAQDDTDFENIKVKELTGDYLIQLEKVDESNSDKKLEGVTFEVNGEEFTTKANGMVTLTLDTTITDTTTKDIYTIKELDLGNNEYVKLNQNIVVYVTKGLVNDNTLMATGVSFAGDSNVTEQQVTLENGDTVTVKAEVTDNIVKITIPNEQKEFDLALKKWVSKAIVIENGKETVTETGHTGDENPEPIVKVDLKKANINDVVVKFEYQIKVTNEGEIAGYAKEVSDYIPEGLKFVVADNPNWEEVDGKVVTDELADTLLQPGESATVTITLTWINSESNMGLKVNTAEISKDYNEPDIPDRDSTPNNEVPGEDDIDDAPVMLTVKTGETQKYIALTISVLGIITIGIVLIKKYVL